jgi:lincosamide nucleotidyltransferase A/C/D/E
VDLTEVQRVLQTLDEHAARYWVLGGWGVDALVGRQTREHRDLDLAIDEAQWDTCLDAVAALGYTLETDWWPIRVELASPLGWVDLHPVRFAESGDGVQTGPDGTTFDYPREHLVTGVLGGRAVPCVSAAWQERVHTGYEPRPQDLLDLAVLRWLA